MFFRKFVPQTLRDMWYTEFEQLRQGTMTVSEYAIRFSELSRHAPTLVPTVRKRVRRFIKGLSYDLKFSMAQELQTDTPFQQVVEIARILEHIRGEERENKDTKRSRGSVGFSGFYPSAMTYHGGGSGYRPVQSALQTTLGSPVSSFSAPTVRGSYSDYFSYPAQTRYEQPRPQRGHYECGDTRHIMRDCPRLGRGRFYQSTQAMGSIPVSTPPAQLVRSGG
ncbi:uncharacterized protein [Nicotiana tomentosiformis]|uniref:uncharacterized protein n=1 Tax=Nicotiana tomentosiformis TaxID=4098 RepID=UPI00388C51E8